MQSIKKLAFGASVFLGSMGMAIAAPCGSEGLPACQVPEPSSLPLLGLGLVERVQMSDRALNQLRVQQARYDTLVRTSTLQYDAGRRSLLQLSEIVGTRFIVHQRTAEQLMQKRSAQARMLALQGELLPRLGLSN
jgi:hypothetical protein